MPIIAVSGRIGSGKDALYRAIHEVDPRFEQRLFAYKLKQICALLTGTSIEEQLSREGKERYLMSWGMTIGAMQQRLGTDAIRSGLHPDAWIIALMSDYKRRSFWVVTDARFPNEVSAILDRDGVVVRIDGSRTGPQGRDPNHISETALDDWDYWDYRFTNGGGWEDLQRHAGNILDILWSRMD